MSAKRSKSSKISSSVKDGIHKPTNFVLKATPAPKQLTSSLLMPSSSTPRRTIQPKSPAARLNTTISKSSPLSAPAGRSPTRGKRSGILSNRRRTAGPFSRIDPPSFSLGGSSSAPFSLDAALKGTISNYSSSRATPTVAKPKSAALQEEDDLKASWFFDIHEDTPEQEMTNLLQHGTCVLDISSDEESAQRAKREGRDDKENVPPMDDISQTSARAQGRLRNSAGADDMVVEKERVALGEMSAADFYAEGCDETSVILVPADEEEQQQQQQQAEAQPAPQVEQQPIVNEFEFAPELKSLPSAPSPQAEPEPVPETSQAEIDVLMGRSDEVSVPAKDSLLQPIEGTGDSFELWESGSAKDESEPTVVEASS